jgi:putative colanic acid biosynthesis UDP-glucose lipid carrier transferase
MTSFRASLYEVERSATPNRQGQLQNGYAMSRGNLRTDALFYARLFMVSECIFVYFGFLVSHVIHYGNVNMQSEVMLVTFLSIGLFYSTYSMAGMYKAWRGIRMRAEFQKAVACWMFIVAGASIFMFLTKSAEVVSRLWFGWGVVIAFVCVCTFRFAVRLALAWARRKGLNFRSVIFIGADRTSSDVIRRLNAHRWVGLNPVAIFDDEPAVVGRSIEDVPVNGAINEVYDYIEARRKQDNPIDQVWISMNERSEMMINDLLLKLEDTSVDVRLIPNFYGLQLSSGMIDEVADIPVVNLSKVRKDNVSESVKSVLDLVVALMVVVLLSPLFLIISLLIMRESPGGAIFKQRRYGVDGKEINVWKFRTMRVAERSDVVVQATRDDARVTKLGKFLRRTSLDELPQFFNVLSGKMSVVGPRPHAVSHNEEYRQKIHGYMGRHKIKPGITGWAQVNGWRGETDTLHKMETRLKYDIEYINNWSLWLDIKIILLTIVRGFTHKNAY